MRHYGLLASVGQVDATHPFWQSHWRMAPTASLGEIPGVSAQAAQEALLRRGFAVHALGAGYTSVAELFDRFDRGVGTMTAGDHLLVYFCGHGVRRPAGLDDNLTDKALDEGWAFSDGVFWDDDLTRLIGRLPRDTWLTVVSDCCFGGIADEARWRPVEGVSVWAVAADGMPVTPTTAPTPFTRALLAALDAHQSWGGVIEQMKAASLPTRPVLRLGGAAQRTTPTTWMCVEELRAAPA